MTFWCKHYRCKTSQKRYRYSFRHSELSLARAVVTHVQNAELCHLYGVIAQIPPNAITSYCCHGTPMTPPRYPPSDVGIEGLWWQLHTNMWNTSDTEKLWVRGRCVIVLVKAHNVFHSRHRMILLIRLQQVIVTLFSWFCYDPSPPGATRGTWRASRERCQKPWSCFTS